MAVAAAVPAVVAEDHGRELRVHGDAIFDSARFLRAGEQFTRLVILRSI